MREPSAHSFIARIAERVAVAGLLMAGSASAEAVVAAPAPAATAQTTMSPVATAPVATAPAATAPAATAPAAAVPAATAPSADSGVDAAATQFAETCAGCHVIGGGQSRGPDLANVAGWPDAQLAPAVKSMERKVGPLSDQQVTALVALLKDVHVQQRVATAKNKLTSATAATAVPADSLLGGALFFGHTGLGNGGMACSSCHQFRGEGGDLGPDLTHFGDSVDLEALSGSIGRAAFPVMRAAYENHPIGAEEARHIAAFLKQAKAPRRVAPLSDPNLAGFGLGIGAFALVLLLIRTRSGGVRQRLVQRATKR